MKAATRSRWLELVRRRRAARRGRDLLEEKRGALIRALAAARKERDAAREKAGARLDAARALLSQAEVEIGPDTIDAALLAQPRDVRLSSETRRVTGVRIESFAASFPRLRLSYSPDGTTETLDRAAAAFAEALPLLVELANREGVVDGLVRGLRRATRRTNALERIVLPALDFEIRGIDETLEEEARDESLRMRRRAARE